MTKTIKELLDEIEEIFDYNLSLHKPEGRRQLERVISQVEALVRRETVEDISELIPNTYHEVPCIKVLKLISDYAKTKNITL